MRRIALLGTLVIAALAAVLVRGSGPDDGTASSHREAPEISRDPTADNTDTYAFVSPDRPDTVTLIANYIPLEEPAGGPNFHEFGEDVLYQLRVDNNGDGRPDVSYRFRFRTQTRNPSTFLYNTGPIDSLSDTDWNRPQLYSVTRVRGGRTTVLGTGLSTAPVNIGPRSTPSYGSLMQAAVQSLPGGVKTYAGPGDDPFFVDLGSVFDLAGLRPFNPAHVIPRNTETGVDGVGGYNVHTIALQVPIAQLTRDGKVHEAGDPKAVIGVYATASRRRVQIERTGADGDRGPWVQTSRLAIPLVNEVVIPLGRKNQWNGSAPSGDSSFARFYLSPEVTGLANQLYPALDDAPTSGRGDISGLLLQGVPGLTFTSTKKADLIRLNTGVAPTAPVGAGNRLGLLAGDQAGFPNGRRLEDDVTDIELRALTCGYGPTIGPVIESLGFCAGNANRSPNNLLGDGVDANDRPFHTTFPYIAEPHQGYEHVHHPRVGGP
ncbi:MAG TPA: DUF4331 domain-containing protein [Gaiellaceae bacterium]|nr:DUF4331 domain-containing protein [Gaiellaceae bacterium]